MPADRKTVTTASSTGRASLLKRRRPDQIRQAARFFPNPARHVWNPDTIERERTARLAIADRSTNCLVGTIGFHSFHPADGSAEIAYDLMPDFWGKGIATSLCRTVLEWGFAQFSYTRVRAAVLKENIRSLRVLDKCGFRFTESSEGFRMVRGEPRTFLLFERRAGTSR